MAKLYDPSRHMTEAQLSENVRQLCKLLKLESAYHTYNSRRSTPGYPDWTIVGPGGIIFRELKTDKGRVSPAQQRWIDDINEAGGNAGEWRVADWWSGHIRKELEKLTKPKHYSEKCMTVDHSLSFIGVADMKKYLRKAGWYCPEEGTLGEFWRHKETDEIVMVPLRSDATDYLRRVYDLICRLSAYEERTKRLVARDLGANLCPNV